MGGAPHCLGSCYSSYHPFLSTILVMTHCCFLLAPTGGITIGDEDGNTVAIAPTLAEFQGIITIKEDDEEEDNSNEMVTRLRYLVDSLPCTTITSSAKATTHQDPLQMLLSSQRKY